MHVGGAGGGDIFLRSIHFLDGAQLEQAVSISVIGCGSITPIEIVDLCQDVAVCGTVRFHIHLGSVVGGQLLHISNQMLELYLDFMQEERHVECGQSVV